MTATTRSRRYASKRGRRDEASPTAVNNEQEDGEIDATDQNTREMRARKREDAKRRRMETPQSTHDDDESAASDRAGDIDSDIDVIDSDSDSHVATTSREPPPHYVPPSNITFDMLRPHFDKPIGGGGSKSHGHFRANSLEGTAPQRSDRVAQPSPDGAAQTHQRDRRRCTRCRGA